jgi:hypothetical protein
MRRGELRGKEKWHKNNVRERERERERDTHRGTETERVQRNWFACWADPSIEK